MERQVHIIMEIREDDLNAKTENDSTDAKILENDEEASESSNERTEETNETGEETLEDGEETIETSESKLDTYETQVLVNVNSNHELDSSISSFSYETIILTIIMLILGAMLIGGFYHEQ